MKRNSLAGSLVIAIIMLTSGATFNAWAAGVVEDDKADLMESPSYRVSTSMEENLKMLVGKKVYITLDSGKTYAGIVKEVGNSLVSLEKLEGKEYFDALIRIAHISAIDTRFKTPKH